MLEYRATTALAIVGHLWSFVQFTPNAMPDQFADNTISVRSLGILLYRKTYISYAVPYDGRINCFVKGGVGHPAKFHHGFIYRSDWKRVGRIAMEAIQVYPTVYRHDIAVLEYLIFRGDTMYDLLIDRNAQTSGESLIPLE